MLDAPWKPRIGAALAYASGDRDPHDGTSDTFDGLFAGVGGVFGWMNLVSLENLQDYEVYFSVQPCKNLTLAVEYHIVTPYSSMIVLVDLTQKYLLQSLEKLEDRYQREVEAIADTVPRSNTPLIGVPEPEEWLLIGLALAILLWYTLRGKVRLLPGWVAGSHLKHG